MSKKSVSDIMRSEVIFPNGAHPYISATFEVRNHPKVMRAFGIDCDTIGSIEMGHHDGCGGYRWAPYIPDCGQKQILGCANILVIGTPGWYRVIFSDRITGEPKTALDDLLVTVTETDMPAGVLAQFQGGTGPMSCGSQVTIRRGDDGCFYISVDNEAYAICPGSHVTCDPNGFGIMIDGILCPFPPVTAVSKDGDCLTIRIGDETWTICDTNDVTTISKDADGVYTATNPDGSTVSWKMTHVSTNGTGLYTATHEDGSQVSWIGTDSVTTASVDTTDDTITITNPDGSTVTFHYLDAAPKQTHVSRGTGSRQNMQTLTADHDGTWPDTVWRETWMQRNGDIVTIHSWNPIENEWDAVAVEAPENVVILNNPTIYIRKATGSANPPINTQADLTPANAFNSFTAMLAFVKRSYVVGSITVDVEGTFGSREVPTFSASAYKNASAVYLRGNPANVSAFTVQIGDVLDSNSTAISAGFGIDLFISNMAWQWLDVTSGNFNPNFACSAGQNGTITIRDTVRVYGTYNTERVGAPNAICFYANGGRITMESGATVIFDMTAGSALGSYFSASRGGQMTYGAIECRLLRNHKATMSVFSATVSGTLRFSGGNPPAFDQPPTFTGVGSFDAPNIARMQVLSTTDLVNSQGFGGFGNLADWLQANMNLTGGAVTNPVFLVDAYSFFGNKYGSEWTADPRFTGAV